MCDPAPLWAAYGVPAAAAEVDTAGVTWPCSSAARGRVFILSQMRGRVVTWAERRLDHLRCCGGCGLVMRSWCGLGRFAARAALAGAAPCARPTDVLVALATIYAITRAFSLTCRSARRRSFWR